MENNRKTIASIVTYLAKCGVTVGTTGLCSTIAHAAFGKTKLGKAFELTTSVCAGVCMAIGTEAILRSGAKRTVDALADGIDALLKNSIEFREDEAILRSGAKRTVDALADGIDALLKNSIEFREDEAE